MGFGYGGRSRHRSRQDMARGTAVRQRRYTFGSHANTAHVWAQQDPEIVRGQSNDGRVSFDGPNIYSYGTHFVMAHFTSETSHNGRQVVLYNADTYSPSTGTHKGHVRGALRGLPVIVIGIPDLTAFLQWGGPKKAQLAKVNESLCERVADAERYTAAHPDYDWAPRDLESAHESLLAFRHVYKIKTPLPRDFMAWSNERIAREQAKREAHKVSEARRYVGSGKPSLETILAPELHAPTGDESGYQVDDAVRKIEQKLTKLRSHRTTLARAKRFPAMVKRASAAIKLLEPIAETWRAVRDEAAERDRRREDLHTLEGLRRWLAHPDRTRPRAFWNYEETARLAAVAYREGMPDIGDGCMREVHVILWQMAVTWPTMNQQKPTRRATSLDEWRAGKGDAYYYSIDVPDSYTFVRRKGDKLETSRAAVVPWTHALAAFQFATRCRSRGESWERNGHQFRVGSYQLDKIDSEGNITAGCHTIAYAEMLDCALREAPQCVAPPFPLPSTVVLPCPPLALERVRNLVDES